MAHVHPFGRAGPARRRAHRRDSKPFEPRGGAGALDPADVRQHRPGPAGGRRLAVRRDESTVSNDQCSAVLVGVFLLNAPLNGHVPLLPPPTSTAHCTLLALVPPPPHRSSVFCANKPQERVDIEGPLQRLYESRCVSRRRKKERTRYMYYAIDHARLQVLDSMSVRTNPIVRRGGRGGGGGGGGGGWGGGECV